MLKLGKLTDYAVVILSYMAKKQDTLHITHDISKATGISQPTVSKVLKCAVKAKIATSTRGAKGGYRLARVPEHITVGSVINALEGPVALTECNTSHKVCEQATGCRIQGNWALVNQKIANTLESITLADMLLPVTSPKEILIPISSLYR